MVRKVKPVRISKLQRRMKKEGIEALLITNLENLRYLSGFSATAGALLVTDRERILITDFRYLRQAKEEAGNFKLIRMEDSLTEALARLLKKIDIRKLSFEEDSITFHQYRALKAKLKGIKLIPVKGMVENLRAIKTRSEIALLGRAAEIADRAFGHILRELRPGLEEREVAAQLEYLMRRLGAERSAFDTIVASGHRSSLPHAKPLRKKMNEGEIILIDMGAVYQGYHSDLTRTVVLGRIRAKQRKIYETVLKAQRRAIKHIRPEVKASSIDRVARDLIQRAGYGKYFGHGLGHGLGMSIHEEPGLRANNERLLQKGMVFTVEPAIYLPGWGGVRIEDVVVVTEDGCRVLSQAPKGLEK
ncbi:Xaa-Pro peptidase family protein [candidate division NPL-UPA2 bacterium]|nr:Xaa-Pro peptidase family protein [candidate division NPL-UPA2 bacterium]